PRRHLHGVPHLPGPFAHAAEHYVGHARGILDPAERDDHVHLGTDEGAAVRAAGGLRHRGEDTRGLAVETARHFRVGTLAEHQDVLVRPGAHERRGEPVCERKHADEDRDHERDAQRRERRGYRARAHASQVVGDGDFHSTFLSAVTTGSRAACIAGMIPLASISTMAMTLPTAIVPQLTSKPGRKPAALKLVARYRSFAEPRPRIAPVIVIRPASA